MKTKDLVNGNRKAQNVIVELQFKTSIALFAFFLFL